MPPLPYEAYAAETRLDGMRIGVVRELIDKSLLTPRVEQTIDLVDQALADLQSMGAEIVDPGAGGALLTSCVRKYAPKLAGNLFTTQYPELFPVDASGKPVGDHIATLVAMIMDPSKVPEDFSFMSLPRGAAEGENKFSMNLYLAERGDATIKTNTDLVEKANWLSDPSYPDFKSTRVTQDKQTFLDMSDRMLDRFQVQTTSCSACRRSDLDAMAYPTSNTPPEKLGSPAAADGGGRGRTSSSSLGRQGFPAITVPAGFTTEMYDRVVDAAAAEGRRTASPARSSSARSPRGCRSVSTSSAGRSPSRRCSRSHPLRGDNAASRAARGVRPIASMSMRIVGACRGAN